MGFRFMVSVSGSAWNRDAGSGFYSAISLSTVSFSNYIPKVGGAVILSRQLPEGSTGRDYLLCRRWKTTANFAHCVVLGHISGAGRGPLKNAYVVFGTESHRETSDGITQGIQESRCRVGKKVPLIGAVWRVHIFLNDTAIIIVIIGSGTGRTVLFDSTAIRGNQVAGRIVGKRTGPGLVAVIFYRRRAQQAGAIAVVFI